MKSYAQLPVILIIMVSFLAAATSCESNKICMRSGDDVAWWGWSPEFGPRHQLAADIAVHYELHKSWILAILLDLSVLEDPDIELAPLEIATLGFEGSDLAVVAAIIENVPLRRGDLPLQLAISRWVGDHRTGVAGEYVILDRNKGAWRSFVTEPIGLIARNKLTSLTRIDYGPTTLEWRSALIRLSNERQQEVLLRH